MTLVERIRALANQRNMSLPDLENATGLGNGTISRWKNASPNTDKLTKVADYLNVSVDYLLGREISDTDNTAKNETERKLLVLCRKAGEVPKEEKEAILKNFEATMDMYLRAKGIKKD